jgi:phage recombination protein Bet
MSNQLIEYKANYMTDAGDKIELNNEIVRKVLAVGDNITDVELYSFIKLCEYQKLNPFIREAYLIKFGKQSQMVVGVDVFTNRLNEHPLCEGWKAGLIIEKAGEIINREGTFYLKGQEKIVGAWFNVHRKGWKDIFPWTVTFSEYYREVMDKDTKKYRGQGQWATMPATMIVKCAITSGCRKAFPKKFSGMYSPEEMGIETQENENIIPIENDDIKTSKQERKIINEEEIMNIKAAAKSPLVEIDSEKLIKYVLDEVKKVKKMNKNIALETFPLKHYDLFLERIKKCVLVKEKNTAKDGPLPDKSTTKNEDNINLDGDLPVKEMEYAKPANTKNDNKEKNTNKKEENNKDGKK